MDFQQLNKQLKELGVKPKDDLRASLYIDHLEGLKTYFLKELKTYFTKIYLLDHQAKYSFIKTAVTSKNLLNELAEVLDFFVAPAVAADLKRASATQPGCTYREYFDSVIFDKDPAKYQGKLLAFRTRYPITDHALKQLCQNFRNNIVEMCERVIADRDLLIDFYKDLYNNSLSINSLFNITSTGSDFHKGGKQVLILTFVISYKPQNLNKRTIATLKVVYKPSDLEVDCLIAGDSSAINRVFPRTKFMENSLFEIYNNRLNKYKQQVTPAEPLYGELLLYGEPLDTYRILPRNFISPQQIKYPLPIREAYGYIEYLNYSVYTHRVLFDNQFNEFMVAGKNDYLIFPNNKNKTGIINQFYCKSGTFAALACTFSLLDMHCGNVRVMKYSPYFIDLETSLTKEVNDIRDTDLLAITTSGHNIGGINGLFNEEKSGWVITKASSALNRKEEWSIKEDYLLKYFQNRLWSSSPSDVKSGAFSGIMTAIPVNDCALLEGFQIGMTILSECQKNKDFQSWFARIENVVVRYLMAGTGTLEQLRNKCFVEDISKEKQLLPTLEGLLREAYIKLSKEYTAGHNPDFIWAALEQTKQDYLTLDIPVFYHRIGTSDIIDSLGNQVTFPRKINLPRSTFFADGPTKHNVERNQVQILGDERLTNRLLAIQKSIENIIPESIDNDQMVKEKLFRPIKH